MDRTNAGYLDQTAADLISVQEAAERMQCAVPTLLLILQQHPDLSDRVMQRTNGDEHVRLNWHVLARWLTHENPRWREDLPPAV
jgi:hypothetical protein